MEGRLGTDHGRFGTKPEREVIFRWSGVGIDGGDGFPGWDVFGGISPVGSIDGVAGGGERVAK